MQRALIYGGLIVAAIGILWPWLVKLPFGRLPGDIIIDRPGFKLYFPVTTMILISLLLSLAARFFKK